MGATKCVPRRAKNIVNTEQRASHDEPAISNWHEAFSEHGFIPYKGTRAYSNMQRMIRKICRPIPKD